MNGIQLPSSTLAVGSKLNAVESKHPGISSCAEEDENKIFVSIQGLPAASCPSKFKYPESSPEVVNWPSNTKPLASGIHKGSSGVRNIDASELGVPPKFQDDPDKLLSKPKSPIVEGAEL